LANSGSEAVEIALHHAYYEWLQRIEKLRDQQLQLLWFFRSNRCSEGLGNKHAKAVGKYTGILVINNGFHGLTSGARSLLNHKKRRVSFSGLLKPTPLFIDENDPEWKLKIDNHIANTTTTIDVVAREQGVYMIKQQKICNVIAAMFEPVMGEGGIHVVNCSAAACPDHIRAGHN
jgi:4-aminobutyrate aminotransferase-like enzyme